MNSNQPRRRKVEKPFALAFFAMTIIITVAIFFIGIALLFPKTWSVQVSSSILTVFLVSVAVHFAAGIFEGFFHRYVFHMYITPIGFIKNLYDQHVLHHGLTNVRLIRKSEKLYIVFNRYAIVEEKQHEASYFPFYALAGFLLAASPVFIILQVCLPSLPIIIGGIVGVTWSMILYELIHAYEHKSDQLFWKPKIEHPYWGRFWKPIYAFHLRHHANVKCNEAVGGFFGLPVFDWICGTYKSSRLILFDGVPALEQDFAPPTPIWVIRKIDAWAEGVMNNLKYQKKA